MAARTSTTHGGAAKRVWPLMSTWIFCESRLRSAPPGEAPRWNTVKNSAVNAGPRTVSVLAAMDRAAATTTARR